MRGLTAAALYSPADPEPRVRDILDRRLAPGSAAPLAVALSGGGDSVALTLIAADWARQNHRDLVILTVDHRLNPASAQWTQICARLARRLDVRFIPLSWEGGKPATGLPAAARAARHALLADAAREAGAQVILMGHTADDRAEGAAMRAAGSTTPDPRQWTPSPAWPQGRGMFLLRPMLDIGRSELRAWLSGRGETWVEDPANGDPRFARARSRMALADAPPPAAPEPPPADLANLARRVEGDTVLRLSRDDLRAGSLAAARALVGAACLCVAGTTRPPRAERKDRLAEALRGHDPMVATLAGARIEADDREILWLRTAGEITRHGDGNLALEAGQCGVWDGRFEVATDRPLRLGPLAGHAARLSPKARAVLLRWPAAARGGLPAVLGDAVTCPVIEPTAGLRLRPLARERLLAACGAVDREPF